MFQVVNSAELAALQDGIGTEGSLGVLYQDQRSGRVSVWNPQAREMRGIASSGGAASVRLCADRMSASYVAGQTRFLVVGDSFAAGVGATSASTTSFYALLAARYSGRLVPANYGNSGSPLHAYTRGTLQIGSGASSASAVQIASGDITACIIGLNDLRGGDLGGAPGGAGPNPSNYAELRARVIGMATQFLIPESNKTRLTNAAQSAVNSALTFSGSWTVGWLGNAAQVYALANNASVSGTTAAGNVLVIRYGINSSADAALTFSVTVDGVDLGSYAARAAYDANWTRSAIVVPLPTRGTHTFTITKTGGDTLMLESVDCVDTKAMPATVFAYATPLYLNDSNGVGWNVAPSANSATAASVTGATAWLYGNGAADRFGAAVDDAMNHLAALGFGVVRALPQAGWNPNTMLAADTLHPNDRGHAHIARAFAAILDQIVP